VAADCNGFRQQPWCAPIVSPAPPPPCPGAPIGIARRKCGKWQLTRDAPPGFNGGMTGLVGRGQWMASSIGWMTADGAQGPEFGVEQFGAWLDDVEMIDCRAVSVR
jgi:hypothetical protein